MRRKNDYCEISFDENRRASRPGWRVRLIYYVREREFSWSSVMIGARGPRRNMLKTGHQRRRERYSLVDLSRSRPVRDPQDHRPE